MQTEPQDADKKERPLHRFIKLHFTDSKAETIRKPTALPSSLQDFVKLEPPRTEIIIF